MPGSIRPNKKASIIAYKLLKTPRERIQDNKKRPNIKRLRAWFRDSSTAQ